MSNKTIGEHMKECKKCAITKEDTQYTANKRNKDGLQSYCRECNNQIKKDHGKTKKGVISRIWETQLTNSKLRGHSKPEYTKQELISWFRDNDEKFTKLHTQWTALGHTKESKPSVDRFDDKIGYTLANIQLMTWQENRDKHHRDVLNGVDTRNSRAVHKYNKSGEYVCSYCSLIDAERETGVARKSIRECISGELNRAGKWLWSNDKIGIMDRKITHTVYDRFTLEGVLIDTWYDGATASRELSIAESTIGQASKGKRITAGGYKWKRRQIIGESDEYRNIRR